MDKQKVIKTLIYELEWEFNLMFPVLKTITKEIAQWKPSPRALTLETLKEGNQKGYEWFTKQELDPLSTIECKVVHLAQCKQMYIDYAFGNKSLKWPDLPCPEWPDTLDYFKQTHLKSLEFIQTIDDEKLEELVLTHFNEEWTFKKIITVLVFHDAYHFGQIRTMKNYQEVNEK